MTLKEVSERFKVAESSIKNSFPRVQKSLLKKYDIHLIKEGRGSSANYKVVEEESDFHALTMYEETKNEIILNKESVRMMNWTFSVFLGIIFTPMLVFRGSFTDFLKYIGVTPSLANINALKGALAELEENEYISYTLDKTDLNYFVAALYRKTEEEMHVGISMVRRCKQIAEIHHKKSWIPLLKVWLGMQIVADQGIFKMSELESITGLSAYQVREAKKLLEKDDIFRTSRAYIAFNTCVGSQVELNGFFN